MLWSRSSFRQPSMRSADGDAESLPVLYTHRSSSPFGSFLALRTKPKRPGETFSVPCTQTLPVVIWLPLSALQMQNQHAHPHKSFFRKSDLGAQKGPSQARSKLSGHRKSQECSMLQTRIFCIKEEACDGECELTMLCLCASLLSRCLVVGKEAVYASI